MVVPMPSPRLITVILSLSVLLLVFFSLSHWRPVPYRGAGGLHRPHGQRPALAKPRPSPRPIHAADPSARLKHAETLVREAGEIAAAGPIQPPYKSKFGTLGHLTRTARQWVEFIDDAPEGQDIHALQEATESAIASLFPYLLHSPKHPESTTPFADLRGSFLRGSRGLVIPTGRSTLRYAVHLIAALQEVLETALPILVVYAGDQDLPEDHRRLIQSKVKDIGFLDILTVVDDSLLKLGDGGWAIKPFAALYAPFEQVIMADADSVFAQKPEVLLKDPSYTETGALLFHDRLIWQHAFQTRHDWWRSEIKHPSAALNQSLVWTDDYAEEGDSGVVVLDKSRIDVLMGLLHVAWQNTKAVRDEVTYKLTYGDKESWWFGLELSGARYAFEKHYASIVGWPSSDANGGDSDKVCSFYIGHVDANDELLWYNGGLLKNKRGDAHEFGLPTHMMIDGKWHKGGDRSKESCMDEKKAIELSHDTIAMVDRAISLAQVLDRELGF